MADFYYVNGAKMNNEQYHAFLAQTAGKYMTPQAVRDWLASHEAKKSQSN